MTTKDQAHYYNPAESSPDFAAVEEAVMEYWKKERTFYCSVEGRPAKDDAGKNNEYIFYDGPPFANGLPHYGHLLTGFVKDLFARYHTMKGQRVERKFGWDCHGLPAEMGAEKDLNVSGRHAIIQYGIDKFNTHCQTSVMKYAGEWERYVDRQARWVDFAGGYKTMDKNYMESVIWAFKQLFTKGLLYESMRVMPYSWACETPLSNFETRLDNSYRERADKAITVAFTLLSRPSALPEGNEPVKLLAWTTTPWTLPSNLALAVGKEVTYTAIKKDGAYYILADSALAKYRQELLGDKEAELPEDRVRFKGEALEGLCYEPLLPYFANHPNAFKVLCGAFVEEGEGCAIVHIAPGFGEDDQALCDANNIELVCPVDSAGKFTAPVKEFEGIQVFDANDEIIKKLKQEGKWLKTEQILHNYPHCWRTDTPLIYKAVPSWYVKVTDFKDRMVELNQQINWIPDHIKDGLFGKWLENARDWSITRNRFWGCPVPVWRSDNPEYPRIDVYGSIEELERDFGVKVTDLHRPFIDQLTRPNPDDPSGKSTMRRVDDVLDCWFESGSMPFAQAHYPFENKQWFEQHFPADFIVEYVAQTRGWFYTLMVLSTALFDRPPFKNCICHGVVLDINGQKLSKRLQNYPDPLEIFNQYGADAMRWFMMASPIMRGGELLIDKDGEAIRDTLRLVIKPLWNAYHFFVLYANSDGVQANINYQSDNVMDRYILSKCRHMVESCRAALDAYDTPTACQAVESFIEALNNWYIRRSRPRFWKEAHDADKSLAYDTLYTVLHTLCRVAAPLMPIITDHIFRGLQWAHAAGESVHLDFYPDPAAFPACPELEAEMDRVRDACNAALSLRNQLQIRIRQPLPSLWIYGKDADHLLAYADIIQDELNVKEVHFKQEVADVAEFKLKIHFPVLGKRLPEKMKQIIPAAKQGQWEIEEGGRIRILGELLEPSEAELLLEAKNPENTQPLSSKDAVVVLDTKISEALLKEGIARDVVRLIQQARKEANLNISSTIDLVVHSEHAPLQEAVANYFRHPEFAIAEQTLAASLNERQAEQCPHRFNESWEGHAVVIAFAEAA